MLMKLCLALAGVAAKAAMVDPPVPVPAINLTQYTGRWYQIADYPQFYEVFCKYCTTADYTSESNGHIGVLNSCRSSPSKSPTTINGDASVPDPSKPAELIVKFFHGLSEGQYWVIALGDVDQGQYEWAVVSDEKRTSLYILSRTPTLQNTTLDKVNGFLKDNGFNLDKLRYTDQSQCGWSGLENNNNLLPESDELDKMPLLATNTTLYKVESERCGQSTLNSAFAPAAKAFAGLKDGTCPDHGYTVPNGTDTMKVPVIGTVKIEYFIK